MRILAHPETSRGWPPAILFEETVALEIGSPCGEESLLNGGLGGTGMVGDYTAKLVW